MEQTLLFELYTVIFVMMRMMGMVLFNPLVGRNNIPIVYRIGLVMILTFLVFEYVPVGQVYYQTVVGTVTALLLELLVGYFLGYLVYCILTVFSVGGELIDMQLGLSMAQMYDSSSNVNMSLVGTIYNLLFMLCFFAVDGHLTLIQLMIQSYTVVPVGQVVLNSQLAIYCVEFFGAILTLAVKLAIPVVSIQLITEVAVGILMKAIPQINVFVLNIQLKLIIGFFIIFAMVPNYADYIQKLMDILFGNISAGLAMFFI